MDDSSEPRPPLKVMIVAAIFPPENAISALRVGKFARYLAEFGDQVSVVTRIAPSAPSEDTEDADRFQVHRFRDPLSRLERSVKGVASSTSGSSLASRVRGTFLFIKVRRRLTRALMWPDRFIFWALTTLRQTRRGVTRPDVIIASAPPLSALIVGSILARRYGCPWVADYRDLLAFGTYNESGALRTRIERMVERRVVRSAAGIVTVSGPLARDLEAVFDRNVQVITNGYDPIDFPSNGAVQPRAGAVRPLTLTYCGEIYPGKRDPSPLFEAMARIEKEGLLVRADFYGSGSGALDGLVEKYGVRHLVDLHPRVPHAASCAIQRESDLLLLLMWNDAREEGVYSGKIFEYLGARRPILMLGYEQGVAADLITSRGAGVVANDPLSIANALRSWATKHARGGVPDLPESIGIGLTRKDQARQLRSVLTHVTSGAHT